MLTSVFHPLPFPTLKVRIASELVAQAFRMLYFVRRRFRADFGV